MMDDGYESDALKEQAIKLGFTAVGVCPAVAAPHFDHYRRWLANHHHASMAFMESHQEIRRHPEGLLPGVRSIVAVALNYNQPNPSVEGRPYVARYAVGRDYHRVLRSKLRSLERWISQNHPGEVCRSCVDSAPIFERDYARLAGLGWFGKNTCLIDTKRGSWFVIGLLLTTVPYIPDAPAVGQCGTCRRCIDACPTGAIVFEDDRWQIDARRCISYWTIEHEGSLEIDAHGWTFGCDICQEVCPFNQPRQSQPLRAVETTEPDFARRALPSLLELADIDYETWDRLTRGSPIRRCGYEGLRRNARSSLKRGYPQSPN